MRSKSVLALLAVITVVGSGCGARLSHRQLLAATAGGGNGSVQGVVGAGDEGTDTGSTDQAATAGGTTTGGAAGGATGSGSAAGGAAGGAAAAKCDPGATDVGVTDNSILLGNVSTLTGPVPGLFKGAVVGAQAFVAYQNSLGGFCGHQLKLKVGDDRLDGNEHRNQIVAQIPQVFAFLGSFSVYDDGGAEELGKSGLPDVGYALSQERANLKNNYSIQPLPAGWRLGPLNYFKQHFADAVGHVGALVVDVPAPKQSYAGEKDAMTHNGYAVTYERFFQATETDFTADVVKMKNGGAGTTDGKPVQMIIMAADAASMARVAKAMNDQSWDIPLKNFGANAYDKSYLAQGGAGTEHSLIDQQLSMYLGEDAGAVPEVALFDQWVKRVSPGTNPDIFAAFAWASGRLLMQALTTEGSRITRAALTAALSKIDNFDANGLVASAGPASKRPPTCYMLVRVEGGKFVRAEPAGKGFRCDDGGYWYKR